MLSNCKFNRLNLLECKLSKVDQLGSFLDQSIQPISSDAAFFLKKKNFVEKTVT